MSLTRGVDIQLFPLQLSKSNHQHIRFFYNPYTAKGQDPFACSINDMTKNLSAVFSSPRRSRSSTTAARAAAAPRLVHSPSIVSSGSKPASDSVVSSAFGPQAQLRPSEHLPRLTRPSAAAAPSAVLSTIAHLAREGSVALPPTIIGTAQTVPESLDLRAVYDARCVAFERELAQASHLFDKYCLLVDRNNKLLLPLADATQLATVSLDRIINARDDPASADCRMVEGRMMRRGDRKAQYRRAHSLNVAKEDKARKPVDAMWQRLKTARFEKQKAMQATDEAREKMEEAQRNWLASM